MYCRLHYTWEASSIRSRVPYRLWCVYTVQVLEWLCVMPGCGMCQCVLTWSATPPQVLFGLHQVWLSGNKVTSWAIFFILSVTSNLGNFLTLKRNILGDISPILNSNWLKCSITQCGDARCCHRCAVWWPLFIERILRQDFKIHNVMCVFWNPAWEFSH